MRAFHAIMCAALFVAAPAQAEFVQVPSRPGVTVPIAIEPPNGPAAAWALLFVGGDGALNLSDAGAPRSVLSSVYVIRSRQHLTAAGIGVVVVDMPGGVGGNPRFRRSPEHMADVGAVVRTIRQRFNRPVWIVGHSNGGITAGGAARTLSGAARPDGLVLTSATNVKIRRDPGTPMDPFPYTGPVLVIAHQSDGCSYSPPSDAPILLAAFTAARPKALRMFTGGSGVRGDPCFGSSYHSFIGIEAQVMAAIAAFIRNPR
jgi:pimeloyl-ACP methyl ester carboxylesterase